MPCGGAMGTIACIEDPEVIEQILTRLDANGLIHGALACWHLGYPDAAMEGCRTAVHFEEQLHHPPSFARAACVASWTAILNGDQPSAERFARLGYAVSSELDAEYWRGWAKALLGVAIEDATATVRGSDELRATGAKLWETM